MKLAKWAMALGAVAALLSPMGAQQARAETKELRIAIQPGILFFPMWLMREQNLVEKHAQRLGLGDLKTNWLNLTSGGANADALLSGNVDVVAGGVSNMLILWSRSKGQIKSFAAVSGVPNVLLTRDPNVKTLKDFTEKNRIAVPTIKMSLQAIFLQMALDQTFGEGSYGKFDPMMVQMGHPQATIALLDPSNPVDSHFSGPPFMQIALKNPNVRAVISSVDIIGEVSSLVAYSATKFYEANPKTIEAFVAALDEAQKFALADRRKAAEVYLAATKERATVDEVVEMLGERGMVFSIVPQGTMKFAEHMHKVGSLDRKPANWQEYFFASMHKAPGS